MRHSCHWRRQGEATRAAFAAHCSYWSPSFLWGQRRTLVSPCPEDVHLQKRGDRLQSAGVDPVRACDCDSGYAVATWPAAWQRPCFRRWCGSSKQSGYHTECLTSGGRDSRHGMQLGQWSTACRGPTRSLSGQQIAKKGGRELLERSFCFAPSCLRWGASGHLPRWFW